MAKSFFDRFDKKLFELDELRGLDRDMNFRPAAPQTPRVLSIEQLEAYNRDGYYCPLGCFDADEIAVYRSGFDKLLDATLAEGSDSLSVVDPHLHHAWMYDLLFEPRVVDCVKDLIGEDIACWGTHYFCKLPHETKHVAWHQDAFYWPFERARTVTVWLAIDDADRANGCMQVVAGSHLHGSIEHRVTREEEQNALRFTVEGAEVYGTIADIAMTAGQFSVHSDLLLHGSGPNPSDRRRCGLTIRYIAADTANFADWNKSGVMICGEDVRGLWPNAPRPEDN